MSDAVKYAKAAGTRFEYGHYVVDSNGERKARKDGTAKTLEEALTLNGMEQACSGKQLPQSYVLRSRSIVPPPQSGQRSSSRLPSTTT